MPGYLKVSNRPGFAKWLRVQTQEEWEHALKFLDFGIARGGGVTLYAVDPPMSDFRRSMGSICAVARGTRDGRDENLYALAAKENDYPAQVLLQWFISKQVEEEKKAQLIVEQLRWAGDSSSALLLLDRGTRANAAKSKGQVKPPLSVRRVSHHSK